MASTYTHAKEGKRNSSIELLRILSMFVILAHHFAVHNAFDYTLMDAGLSRLFVQLFLESGGKIGVIVFFTITAWFFLEKKQTLMGSFRKIMMLEKEVLFYSVVLSLLFYFVGYPGFGLADLAKGFFPLIFTIWWYPTAYALFLLFLPFLTEGLKALSRISHLSLCLILLLLYGILSMVPGVTWAYDVYSFVYLFILIAAYRWYYEGKNDFQPWALIASGLAMLLVFSIAAMVAFQLFGKQVGTPHGWSISNFESLPELLVGFGLFLLFNRCSFHCRLINEIAGGAFAVYLITDFYYMRSVLWGGCLDLQTLSLEPFGYLFSFAALIVIYLACIFTDIVRKKLFSCTFDSVWNRLVDFTLFRLSALRDRLIGQPDGSHE